MKVGATRGRLRESRAGKREGERENGVSQDEGEGTEGRDDGRLREGKRGGEKGVGCHSAANEQ